MSIPWGDVFTAFITTGIPFISTYTGAKPSMYNILKLQRLFNPLLRTALFRNWIKKKIKARPAGPDDASRAKAKAYIWGEVRNASGKTVQHWFCCPEGYTLTALTATAITQKVLAGLAKPGYQTPAGCFGSALINAWITEKGPILQA